MRRKTLPSVLLATCLVSVAVTGPASAGSGSNQGSGQAAQDQFAQALKRFDSKDYAGALELFRKSYEGSGSPNARLYIARCLRELGKNAEAYEEMQATVREATERAQSETKYAQTRDAAAAELALLEPKVGKIIVALADPPQGTEVTLNGSPLAAERVGAPVAVEPGTMHIVAKAPGKKPVESEVSVGAGETKTAALTFQKDTALSETTGDRRGTTSADEGEMKGGGVRTAGFVVVGLGVAGMAVFGVAAAMAEKKFSTLEDDCGGVRCTDPKYADAVDSGKTLDTVANIGLVAGGVGLVAGVLMIAFGGPKRAAPVAAAFANPPVRGATIGLSPRGAALRYRF